MNKSELLRQMRDGYVHLWAYVDPFDRRERFIATHRPYSDENPETQFGEDVQERSIQSLIRDGLIEKVKRDDGYTFLRLTEARPS